MKIAWFSNAPWVSTGYGNQTKLWTPRLVDDGHEVAIIATYGLEGGVLRWHKGIPVYPRGLHGYGMDVLAAHSLHFQADITISLLDAWVFEPSMFGQARWVTWFPVDMEPIPPQVALKVSKAWRGVTYSHYGVKQARRAGLDAAYVPHGYDPAVFSPGDRAAARALLGWDSGRYIVGMVAANKDYPSRKAWPQALAAFAQFKRRHPEAFLYAHTNAGDVTPAGVNLPECARFYGLEIGEDVVFADPYANMIGFPDEYMAAVYRGMDVLLNPAMGEGFGIPVLEAQACGTPVIVGDWTSTSELFFGGALIPKAEAEPFYTQLAAVQYLPRINAIADALETVYRERPPVAAAGVEAYQADRVQAQYWRPFLAECAERVAAEKARAA